MSEWHLNFQQTQQDIMAVFDERSVNLAQEYVAEGSKVYLSLPVFSGDTDFKANDDVRAVTSDGTKLPVYSYGVCPTHPGWRQSRLQTISEWATTFQGYHLFQGIFLEFIRYPGVWETEQPILPDTCYCERCLTLFQVESGVEIPEILTKTSDISIWIHENFRSEWTIWKKKQISGFVREVREVLDSFSPRRHLKLGVFLVPWRKSDFDGSLSFDFAQDPLLLDPHVDIFAPKLFFQEVGQDLNWVGELTRYYNDMVNKEIWPSLKIDSMKADGVINAVETFSRIGVDGLLIDGTSGGRSDLSLDLLNGFKKKENLIPNSQFELNALQASGSGTRQPLKWERNGNASHSENSYFVSAPDENGNRSIGMIGRRGKSISWQTHLPNCVPRQIYRFTGMFYRHDRSDSKAYPSVGAWGSTRVLNTHRMVGTFQELSADFTCPEHGGEENDTFVFKASAPDTTFWLGGPQLVRKDSNHINVQQPPEQFFFPVGLYGVNAGNMREAQASGVNSGVVSFDPSNVQACIDNDLHCTLSVPREPEKLYILLDKLAPLLTLGDFSFYVNDEPGIHSFPIWQAVDIQRILKNRFPNSFTNMAIVRPQVILDYQAGADYFMMDQYPIPNMPMTWLSDSLDSAASIVGENRLQAVIQAFGGDQFTDGGWPRPPSYEEMNCLVYLAIVHGARGLYFFTYPSISSTVKSMDDFQKVIRRLNSMRSWLLQVNEPTRPQVTMISENRYDEKGRAAVHCSLKQQHGTKMMICVNTIRTFVEAEIVVPEPSAEEWQDYFNGTDYTSMGGTLKSWFDPYEVKVLFERR